MEHKYSLKLWSEKTHNNCVNSDSPPRRSFVANATSLAPLRPAGYAKRYV